MNKLAQEKSIYLRHAAHQKIDWYPWTEEAFARARSEGKPVFLSSGAAWCHWCHVMAKESFEDEETARLLNEHFISIKLDRDERPDIDRRFQQAVAAMGNGGGWPLSVFLTPDKQAFFGGTYFPPDDRRGMPGFRSVLRAVAEFYKTKTNEAHSYAGSVMTVLQPEASVPEVLSKDMLEQAEKEILSVFDSRNGGFGKAPKFPMPGVLEFLLRRAAAGSKKAGEAGAAILHAMARGGFHDQLGGGFHRYSVDESWIIPHFEKMIDDNAGLLQNYIEGFALFGEERFLRAAEGILRFTRTTLAHVAGGFYASQDADVTPDDEGGYFTWTESELRAVLDRDEYRVIAEHLLHPQGRMHHDRSKTVLAVNRNSREIADIFGIGIERAEALIAQAKTKLLATRAMRPAPIVDARLYTSLNGMMTAAYFRASMVLHRPDIRDFARASLERIMSRSVRNSGVYRTEEVAGILDDYVFFIDAAVAAYEATGKREYLMRAEELMALCREKFWDREGGGFFDTEAAVLGTRLKRIEDIPHPSANAIAIKLLLKLASITGNEGYRRDAEHALSIFAGDARSMGVHAGTYFCALAAYFHDYTLSLETDPASGLSQAARTAAIRTFSTVIYGEDNGRVVPCLNGVCSEPIIAESILHNYTGKEKMPRAG